MQTETETKTDVEKAIEVQQTELYKWKGILKPEVWKRIVETAIASHKTASDPRDIPCGLALLQIVYAEKNKLAADEAIYRPQVAAFIVMVMGYWGRGKTILEAAQHCHDCGGKRSDPALVKMTIGDDTPEVNDCGEIVYDGCAELRSICNGVKLGALLGLKD